MQCAQISSTYGMFWFLFFPPNSLDESGHLGETPCNLLQGHLQALKVARHPFGLWLSLSYHLVEDCRQWWRHCRDWEQSAPTSRSFAPLVGNRLSYYLASCLHSHLCITLTRMSPLHLCKPNRIPRIVPNSSYYNVPIPKHLTRANSHVWK